MALRSPTESAAQDTLLHRSVFKHPQTSPHFPDMANKQQEAAGPCQLHRRRATAGFKKPIHSRQGVAEKSKVGKRPDATGSRRLTSVVGVMGRGAYHHDVFSLKICVE